MAIMKFYSKLIYDDWRDLLESSRFSHIRLDIRVMFRIWIANFYTEKNFCWK